jgi:hypothetical protein
MLKAVRINDRVWTDPHWHSDALAQARRELFPGMTYPDACEAIDKLADTGKVEVGYYDGGLFEWSHDL